MLSTTDLDSFERRCHFIYPLKSIVPSWVASFGVSPDGDITCDTDTRDGHARKSMVKILQPFFEEVSQNKSKYVRYPSLNPDIEIYGPQSLDPKALLEYTVFSGMVDIRGQVIYNLLPKIRQMTSGHKLASPSNALNGKNHWNSLNLVIDFKHNVILARNYTRLSIYGNTELAESPLSAVIDKYKLGPVTSSLNILAMASTSRLPDASRLVLKSLRQFFSEELFNE